MKVFSPVCFIAKTMLTSSVFEAYSANTKTKSNSGTQHINSVSISFSAKRTSYLPPLSTMAVSVTKKWGKLCMYFVRAIIKLFYYLFSSNSIS